MHRESKISVGSIGFQFPAFYWRHVKTNNSVFERLRSYGCDNKNQHCNDYKYREDYVAYEQALHIYMVRVSFRERLSRDFSRVATPTKAKGNSVEVSTKTSEGKEWQRYRAKS